LRFNPPPEISQEEEKQTSIAAGRDLTNRSNISNTDNRVLEDTANDVVSKVAHQENDLNEETKYKLNFVTIEKKQSNLSQLKSENEGDKKREEEGDQSIKKTVPSDQVS